MQEYLEQMLKQQKYLHHQIKHDYKRGAYVEAMMLSRELASLVMQRIADNLNLYKPFEQSSYRFPDVQSILCQFCNQDTNHLISEGHRESLTPHQIKQVRELLAGLIDTSLADHAPEDGEITKLYANVVSQMGMFSVWRSHANYVKVSELRRMAKQGKRTAFALEKQATAIEAIVDKI